MKIIFIRHTKVDAPDGYCYGQMDVPLAKSFVDEANQIQKNITNHKVDAIYSSPLSRCRILAQTLFFSKEIIFDNRLKEMHFGNWEGMYWNDIEKTDEAKKWFTDYINLPCPKGESFIQMQARIQDFLEDLKSFNYNSVAIVSHSGCFRAFLKILNSMPDDELFKRKIDFGHVEVFQM